MKNTACIILATLIIFGSQVSTQGTPNTDYCKERLKLDDCVGSIPNPSQSDSENKQNGCCFNSLYLDERKLYFCMKRSKQVTYWKWFYDQNKQVDRAKIDQGWDNDHKACCFEILKDAKYKSGCSTSDFGTDSNSDGKLEKYRLCILGKLRAKGTILKEDVGLRCYNGYIYKLSIMLSFLGICLVKFAV